MAQGRFGRFVTAGSIKGVVSDADTETTGFKIGRRYRITLPAGGDAATTQSPGAVFRWGTTAAVSSSTNFDFALAAGESIDVVAQAAALSNREMDATSAATFAFYAQLYAEDEGTA